MNNIENAAIQATFHRQLNTRDAVRYIMTEGNTDKKTAEQALIDAVTYYKQRML
jgi:hypothetical protein